MDFNVKHAQAIKARKVRPAHPGEVVADLLADAGIAQGELALRLGVSRQSVNALLRGRRAVTPDMAQRLGRFFGNGPELWLNLQKNVDLWEALHMNQSAYKGIKPLVPATS